MPQHRARVDPQRDHAGSALAHRRWLLPDDVSRPLGLAQAARLWRGLFELGVLDGASEVALDRVRPDGTVEHADLPALASAGALLAGSGCASLLTQVTFADEEDRRDPYAEGDDGYRDYTLYAIDHPAWLLLPVPPAAIVCGACRARTPFDAPPFGEAALLSLGRPCPACGAGLELSRDRGELRTGAIFLLEELACRLALSIELPAPPEAEELPDAKVAALLQETLGGYDELTDDAVAPAA